MLKGGEGNPGTPLVMLHGYRASADYWLPKTLAAFSADYRVIAPDLPGFGRSGRLREYGLDDMLRRCQLSWMRWDWEK